MILILFWLQQTIFSGWKQKILYLHHFFLIEIPSNLDGQRYYDACIELHDIFDWQNEHNLLQWEHNLHQKSLQTVLLHQDTPWESLLMSCQHNNQHIWWCFHVTMTSEWRFLLQHVLCRTFFLFSGILQHSVVEILDLGQDTPHQSDLYPIHWKEGSHYSQQKIHFEGNQIINF